MTKYVHYLSWRISKAVERMDETKRLFGKSKYPPKELMSNMFNVLWNAGKNRGLRLYIIIPGAFGVVILVILACLLCIRKTKQRGMYLVSLLTQPFGLLI